MLACGKRSNGSLVINSIFIGSFITPILAQAQQSKIPEPAIFPPVTVTATRTEKKTEQLPHAISHIERSKYTDLQPGATLDEFAHGTPGVFFSESI